ncbi:hypothetical protein BGZ94_003862 [Podila epigama]|nr:hypothetical protein BGZ94_003862 [Podila epigama]
MHLQKQTPNIFIPEIITLLALHLSPPDLSSCMRVSRVWFDPCAKQLWRHIQQDQSMWESLTDALPRYAPYVREFHCGRYFNRLKELAEANCQQLAVLRTPLIDNDNVDDLFGILENNPHLKTLSLWFAGRCRYSEIHRILFEKVVRLKNLTSLYIDEPPSTFGTLEQLLEQIPSLEFLGLSSCSAWSTQPPTAWTSSSPQQRPLCPRLTDLELSRIDNFTPLSTVALVAPNLQSLKINDMNFEVDSQPFPFVDVDLKKLCPQLNKLRVSFTEMDRSFFCDLLRSFPSVVSLTIDRVMNPHTILEVLSMQPELCPSLEHLIISTSYVETKRTSRMVASILTHYTSLKELRLFNFYLDKEKLVDSGEWVCDDLEHLVLQFGDFIESDETKAQYDAQLKRLVKLQ